MDGCRHYKEIRGCEWIAVRELEGLPPTQIDKLAHFAQLGFIFLESHADVYVPTANRSRIGTQRRTEHHFEDN